MHTYTHTHVLKSPLAIADGIAIGEFWHERLRKSCLSLPPTSLHHSTPPYMAHRGWRVYTAPAWFVVLPLPYLCSMKELLYVGVGLNQLKYIGCTNTRFMCDVYGTKFNILITMVKLK